MTTRCAVCGWLTAGRACRCEREAWRANVRAVKRLVERGPKAIRQCSDPDLRAWAEQVHAGLRSARIKRLRAGASTQRTRAARWQRCGVSRAYDTPSLVLNYLLGPTGELVDVEQIAASMARKVMRGVWLVEPERDGGRLVRARPFVQYEPASGEAHVLNQVSALPSGPPSRPAGLTFDDWRAAALGEMWRALSHNDLPQLRSLGAFLRRAGRDGILMQWRAWQSPPSVTVVTLDDEATRDRIEAEHVNSWRETTDRLDAIAQAVERLTPRARVVLYLQVIGLTLPEIATRLEVSLRTVERAAAAATAAVAEAGAPLEPARFRHAVARGYLPTPSVISSESLRALSVSRPEPTRRREARP